MPLYLTTQPVQSYEAENAALTGTSTASSKAGYTGSGYVTGFDTVGDKCQFNVNVSTSGAYIMKVRYNTTGDRIVSCYVNGIPLEKLKLGYSEEYGIWTDMTVFAWLQSGNNTVTVQYDTGDSGNLNLDNLSLALYSTTPGSLPDCYPPGSQSTYGNGGNNWSLPGQIEAENYDTGGEGVAFHDSDLDINHGGQYRSDGVDIYSGAGLGNGYYVGWTTDGEWLEYTTNIPTGTYNISARVASESGPGSMQLTVKLDGVTLGTMNVPVTGGWSIWQETALNNINVTGGNGKVLRLEITGGSFNLDWVKFTAASQTEPPNLAIGAAASASSTWDSNYTADKANDGNLNTRWNSQQGRIQGEWLALDFGSQKTFDKVEFDQETTWTRINDYKIQYWDGSTWQDSYVGGMMNDVQVDTFPAKTSQKIRLLVNNTTGNTPTIKEFKVFNTGAPSGHTDEFDSSTLDPAWSWVRQDGSNWSLTESPGNMRIKCQTGDLFQTDNTAKNLLLRSAPAGDWTVTGKLTFNPGSNYQQAGIMAYKDDDNYIKFTRAYSDGNRLSAAKETGGVYMQSLPSEASTVLYLKVVKSANTYTLSYNTDGSTNWTQVAQYTNVDLGTVIKVGVCSFGGSTGVNADFDWFDVK